MTRLLSFLFLVLSSQLHAQSTLELPPLDAFGQPLGSPSITGLRYGLTAHIAFDLNGIQPRKSKRGPEKLSTRRPIVSGALAFGFGYLRKGEKFDLMPHAHIALKATSRGDLGTSYLREHRFVALQFLGSAGFTSGYREQNMSQKKQRQVPIQYLSNLFPEVLGNPFDHSLTLTTSIYQNLRGFDKSEKVKFLNNSKSPLQNNFSRVWFGQLMVSRVASFGTYNDMKLFVLSDGYDRFFTGGGSIQVYRSRESTLEKFELSYHKYTAHVPQAYEVATKLRLDLIPYKDSAAPYFSISRFRLDVDFAGRDYTDTKGFQNGQFFLTLWNPDYDIQDLIHLRRYYALHPDVMRDKSGICNDLQRLGIGGSILGNNSEY